MKTAYKPVVKLAAAAAAAFFAVSSIQVPVTALAYTKPAGSHVLTPIASGVTTYSNEKATPVSYTHLARRAASWCQRSGSF